MTARDYISELKEKPYTKTKRTYEISTGHGSYYITEELRYASAREAFEGTIQCRIPEMKKGSFFGDASLYLDFDTSKNKPYATFEAVHVNSRVENKGIGTQMMLAAINLVKAAKEFYGIEDKIRFSGWLSNVDRGIGNWDKSVPFYYKVGEKAGVEHFFEVNGSDERFFTPDEFLANVGENHGAIVYMIGNTE